LGPGYRIYLVQEGKDLIILFRGGTKNAQESDIETAKKLYQEYKKRKKEEHNLKSDNPKKSTRNKRKS
jgi:hypothetical protein